MTRPPDHTPNELLDIADVAAMIDAYTERKKAELERKQEWSSRAVDTCLNLLETLGIHIPDPYDDTDYIEARNAMGEITVTTRPPAPPTPTPFTAWDHCPYCQHHAVHWLAPHEGAATVTRTCVKCEKHWTQT